MAFLDNSGDIILDVVLTDHGRKEMAKGDGSFQITKFAVCDEEIDYSLYNRNHSSGSSYYDLEILQTPILEAFTNNMSSMKSKLVSYQDTELLYLPILKLNEVDNPRHTSGSFMIAVDRETEGTDAAGTNAAVGVNSSGEYVKGVLFGATFKASQTIRIDQGIHTTDSSGGPKISPKQVSLMANLVEDMYSVKLDSRLGRLATINGSRIGEDYIDDDHIAYYTVDSAGGLVSVNNDDESDVSQAINGPRGTILEFKIAASIELNNSTYLFTKLGGTTTMVNKNGSTSQSVRFIDSTLTVTGMRTGYSIDVPIRFIKTVT